MPTPLDTLLHQSDPLCDTTPAPDSLTELSTALAREVVESDRQSKGRRLGLLRRHKWAAIAAAAVVVVPTTAYAASAFFTQTGTFGRPAVNPDFEDGSEFINLCAGDVADFALTLAPASLPAPPKHSWKEYATNVARSYAGNGACPEGQVGTVQATSLRLGMLGAASSDWGCVLVWADEDGDRATFGQARQQMLALTKEAKRYATIEGTDPTQDPGVFLSNSTLPQWVGCER